MRTHLDAFAGDAYLPQSLHKYIYAHADPVNGMDRTGQSLLSTIVGIGQRAYLAGMSFAASVNTFWVTFGPAMASILLYQSAVSFFNNLAAVATGEDPETGEPLALAGYLYFASMLVLDLAPGKVADAFDKILDYRRLRGLPTAYTGNRQVDGVAALLRVDGDEYLGHSGWMRQEGRAFGDVMDELGERGVRPNAQTVTHAEGHVFYQAIKDKKRAKTAELFVDATFCKACGQNSGLRAFAKALGVEELIVYIRYNYRQVIKGSYKLD